MSVAWVLGSSGLLGSALSRALHGRGCTLFSPQGRLPWGDPPALAQALQSAVQDFGDQAAGAVSWEIYWAAGTGAMGSQADELAGETQALQTLLQQLSADARLMHGDGAVALASSAGAIYAGAADELITEDTVAAPTTPYACAKLQQEDLLRAFVGGRTRPRALVARISTLYGPGQAAGKKQGLLTHMARSILRNRPIQIYVPYDTVRDYIEAGDAAERIVLALRSPAQATRCQLKIIASETPVTIAEIIAIFKRIARKNPRIVTSASRLGRLYTRRVQFRSVVPSDVPAPPPRQIAVGIAQLLMAERAAYMRGPAEHRHPRQDRAA
jgi:UDP-glucose 4-epimerase